MPIVVSTSKHTRVPHIVLPLLAALLSISPSLSHAGVISDFTDKVKAIFVKAEDLDTETLATSQTMALFKPVVVEAAENNSFEEDNASNTDEMLQAVSGPLRVSTEDIEFPETDIVSVYEVKKGDTLTDVAKLFNVSVNTIMWANNLTSRTITKGDTLIILPITGIKLTVKKGDTVKSLAKKYKADVQDITSYNGITEDSALAVGDTVIIPDGEIEIVQSPKKTSSKTNTKKSRILNSYANSTPDGFLVRPVIGGRKTQGIHGHNGIDIAATPGTPVVAAASGRAIVVKIGGYNGGYGNLIIISHEKGIQTFYAHLKESYITQGQTVSQGQVIGEVGNTGRSTGPHLHFEVRGAKNPF